MFKGDAGDGAGGVWADSGKSLQGDGVGRQAAVVILHNQPGSLAQPPDSRVIAQAGPKAQDGLLACAREFVNGGQGSQPSFPIRDDGGGLGLLEHDFADPNGVRVAGAAPREIACVGGVPVKQTGGDTLELSAAGRLHGCGVYAGRLGCGDIL